MNSSKSLVFVEGVGPEDHQIVLGKDDSILNYSYTVKVF